MSNNENVVTDDVVATAPAKSDPAGVVTDDKLAECINEHNDVQKCADALGQLALDSGSRDNVSCIVVEVTETR